MARIKSLSILLSTSGNDYLAEQYGKVVENIQKTAISSMLKNQDLSGTPGAGSVEAKRFVNRTSNAYGTARTGGAGQKVKATPVTITINTDKELITEVEEKDVALYGVDNFVNRQSAMDQKSMTRELERAFFAEAATAGSPLVTAETDIQKVLEALIQAIENTQNDYVDGVDRDMISVTCNTATYGLIREYLDNKQNANVDTGVGEFGRFHGVRVYSSVYLPVGVDMIGMVDGAVAQPVLPTVAPSQKIPLSNAIAFGMFYSYGTKAVMDDLIVYVGNATGLTVVSAAGSTSGKTALTVTPAKAATNSYKYKTAATVTVPDAGSTATTGWTAWNGTDNITAVTGNEIVIVEVDSASHVIKAGKATVTSLA